MSNVRLIKLVTGEELIGIITEDMSGNYTITDPYMLGMVDETRMGFIRYMPYCKLDKGLTIDKSKTLFSVELDPDIENEYRKNTNKLVMPNKNLKLV